MYLFEFFRSLLPFRNPIGFGASDFIEIFLAICFVLLAIASYWIKPVLQTIAARPKTCMLLLGASAILGRLLLLPRSPVPTPSGADDFSYLLLADTLGHLRLANAMHPMRRFFEAVFVLQEPTYSSIFPLGQGMALALGKLITGQYWTGVLMAVAAFSAACFWILRGWVTPGWALLGSVLAMMQFGPLSPWTNSYWGGAVSAFAGCLCFGALPRLTGENRIRNVAILGFGLALQLLTRPFEFVLLLVCVLLYLIHIARRRTGQLFTGKNVTVTLIPIAAAFGMTFAHNGAVTGHWLTLPYMISRYQYGVPTTFMFQQNPTSHRALTQEQELDFRAQAAIHGDKSETVQSFLERLVFRLRYYRFFLYAPLYLPVLIAVFTSREYRQIWVVLSIAIFAIGTNLYPYFFPHYIAATACLFVLLAVQGLHRMTAWRLLGAPAGRELAYLVLFACVAQFVFWYFIHLSSSPVLARAKQYEVWNFVNEDDPDGRIAVDHQLASNQNQPQLVFVHYGPRHQFQEWIQNAADIDHAPVVWALDLGAKENEQLLRYFPNRKAWFLNPDVRPVQLLPYTPEPLQTSIPQ